MIPNGVDIDKFNLKVEGTAKSKDLKKELMIKDRQRVIGFVGTFGPWHGIENLVSAIIKIEEDSRNKDMIFLLMGNGILKKYAEDRINKYNNVLFLGSIPYQEIQDYLSICDILVSPHSLPPGGKEFIGSPTKVFEYMAMGKGIIASDLAQIGKILENGKTAILTEPDNIEEFSEGILKLASDKKLCIELGRNAFEKASNSYTWKKNIKILLDHLRDKNTLK